VLFWQFMADSGELSAFEIQVRRVSQAQLCFYAGCLAYSSILKIEKVRLSKTSVNYQIVCLSWNKAPIYGPRPVFYYCHTVACLLMWRALSDERTGLHITSQHGSRRKHRSSVAVQLLLRDGITYSTVACAAIGTDCAENTTSRLFTGSA
jgi:hypothetical protein